MRIMIKDNFTSEPIVGHVVSAERYEKESNLSDQLDEAAEKLDLSRRNRERIRIRVGDVDWEETNEITMTANVFEKLIEWYEESK